MSLGNVLSASYGGTKKNTFVTEADNELLKKYKVPSQLALALTDIPLYSVWRCFSVWDQKTAFTAFGVMGNAVFSVWDHFGQFWPKIVK